MVKRSYNRRISPVAITLSVWKALFLREAVSRLSVGRAAWLWLLLEPIINIVFLLFMFAFMRMRVVGGIDTGVWIMVGMTSYFMFKRAANQAKTAITANQALFSYRQVKPIDTVLVRASLEGVLMIIIALILAAGGALFGLDLIPADPIVLLTAFLGMWLMGLGFGLIASVAINLIPELGKILDILMMPLYLVSGVMFPLSSLPPSIREWLMLNPLVHGVEAARQAMSSNYHALPELNMNYLYEFAIVIIFLGLALHNRFALKLVMQ
jgi:capsular polysaccharide transport system permease protein